MGIISKVAKYGTGLGTAAIGGAYSYVYFTTPNAVPFELYTKKPVPQLDRQKNLSALRNSVYDMVVIGGGATGTAVAMDGASRGLKVALVERDDFSSGTSSRSTKLLHGGVRYLKDAFMKADFGLLKLVYEALRERAHLIAASPHLSHPLGILVPLYTYFDVLQMWVGIKMYESAASIATLFNTRIPTSYYLSKSSTLYQFPLLKHEGLKGGIMYYDGQQNDSRVNMLMALTASVPDYIEGWQAATIANHVSVVGLDKDTADGSINGVACRDELTGEEFKIATKVVVNATGPFSDSIRKMANPEAIDMIIPAGGVHIVMPKLYSPQRCGMLIPETTDGRVLFYLPWENNTCVGTTDAKSELTPYPVATEKDVDFIVDESIRYLNLSREDVKRDITATWCGLRPLVRDLTSTDTSRLSRDHVVEVCGKSGLVTIAGGKWTTSRLMAEHTVDKALESHRGKIHAKYPCRTWFLKLIGADHGIDSLGGSATVTDYEVVGTKSALALAREYGLEYDDAMALVHNYGSVQAKEVCEIGKAENSLLPIIPNQKILHAEISFAVKNEMAETVTDVIANRTRLAFIDPVETKNVLSPIVDKMGDLKGWSNERRIREFEQATAFLDTMTHPNAKPQAGALRRRTYENIA
jgi:glycerol-3-phosphate dehydrogenase